MVCRQTKITEQRYISETVFKLSVSVPQPASVYILINCTLFQAGALVKIRVKYMENSTDSIGNLHYAFEYEVSLQFYKGVIIM